MSFLRAISRRNNVFLRATYSSKAPVKATFADPVDLATGVEKREMLSQLAGNEDPFETDKLYVRGPGTKAQPNEIPSAFDARLVGCICEEGSCHINFMWLHKGEAKRCECGHWFSLVHKAPV